MAKGAAQVPFVFFFPFDIEQNRLLIYIHSHDEFPFVATYISYRYFNISKVNFSFIAGNLLRLASNDAETWVLIHKTRLTKRITKPNNELLMKDFTSMLKIEQNHAIYSISTTDSPISHFYFL